MTELYTDDNILQFAIGRELAAYHFYTELMKQFSDPVMKDIFRTFADAELEHKEKLELEIMKLGLVVTEPPDLKALEEMAPMVEVPENDETTYTDALLLAIQKEEMDFRLYAMLAGTAESSQVRETFLALAEEEVKHKLRWQAQYDQIMG